MSISSDELAGAIERAALDLFSAWKREEIEFPSGFSRHADEIVPQIVWETESAINTNSFPAIDHARNCARSANEFASIANHGETGLFAKNGTSGRATTFDQLIRSIFSTALIEARLGLRLKTAKEFASRCAILLNDLQSLAKNNTVMTNAIFGLSGITIPPETSIETVWGTAISAPLLDYPPDPNSVGRRVQTLFVVPAETAGWILHNGADLDLPNPDFSFYEYAWNCFENFATACAIVLGGRSAPIASWRTELSVTGGSGWMYTNSRGVDSDVSIGEHFQELSELSEVMESLARSSVHVGEKRLRTAASERTNAEDKLIDSLIVWENLVGAAPETTQRVCGSLAVLLEATAIRRPSFKKELTTIYNLRSRLVHGDSGTSMNVTEAAHQAGSIAAAALHHSYRLGQSWLNMTSSERSDALLLGVIDPHENDSAGATAPKAQAAAKDAR